MKEQNLKIYDVWKSSNGNLFIKMDNDYSLAIGAKGDHSPRIDFNDLNNTQYVKKNDISKVKKVGKIVFD